MESYDNQPIKKTGHYTPSLLFDVKPGEAPQRLKPNA